MTVGATRAVQGTLPVLIDALGTVTPPMAAALVPQVSGVLTQVLFTEGQKVAKGRCWRASTRGPTSRRWRRRAGSAPRTRPSWPPRA
ncbi:hypothetical protein ACFSTJ_01700 [Ottowia pentelensis]|uniref:hypothetical protein n=1 Tax=Ottowia pentelensis TaxID=511108 RepID=UPI0036258F92